MNGMGVVTTQAYTRRQGISYPQAQHPDRTHNASHSLLLSLSEVTAACWMTVVLSTTMPRALRNSC